MPPPSPGFRTAGSMHVWSSGEQADVPAEQPSAGEDARFPPAHAHPGRAGDPRKASGQGPRATVGLTASVLPAAARLRRRAEFTAALRAGGRAGTPLLAVHLVRAEGTGPARAGFIVSRSVGGAVVRNRVRRRLRHLMHARLHRVPAGSAVVVRANPAAAAATFTELGAQLDRALERLSPSGMSPEARR